MPNTFFSIPVLLPDTDVLTFLSVRHTGELFETGVFDEPVSILRNSDTTWSAVGGDASQETVDVIGQAIEDHYLKGK